MSFFLIQPCKSTAAFEAVPQSKLKLDLAGLHSGLQDLGYQIVADARVVLVVEKDGCEVSIFPSGKLMIKVDTEEVAEGIAKELELILK